MFPHFLHRPGPYPGKDTTYLRKSPVRVSGRQFPGKGKEGGAVLRNGWPYLGLETRIRIVYLRLGKQCRAKGRLRQKTRKRVGLSGRGWTVKGSSRAPLVWVTGWPLEQNVLCKGFFWFFRKGPFTVKILSRGLWRRCNPFVSWTVFPKDAPLKESFYGRGLTEVTPTEVPSQDLVGPLTSVSLKPKHVTGSRKEWTIVGP